MEITGKLHRKFGTQQVSEKFTKREFVLIEAGNPMYPQYVKFECTQDRCALLDKFNDGDTLTVAFNFRGREYTDKNTAEVRYFTSIEAWKIDKVAGGSPSIEDIAKRTNLPDLDNDDPFSGL